MEVVDKSVVFSLKKSDLLVQPLAFKSISYLEELMALLKLDIADQEDNHSSRISFIWAFQVKDIALLLRDSVVNLLRIEQLVKDGVKTKNELAEYQENLHTVIKNATAEVQKSYVNCAAHNDELKVEWQHQINPIPTIINQVNKLIDQIKTTQRSQHKLDKLIEKFDDYSSSYLGLMAQRRENTKKILHQLKKLKESVEKEEDVLAKSALTRIDNQIHSSIHEIENNISFTPYQFIVLEDTDKLKLAVGSQAGQLIYKTIDILSEVSGWTSFNLISPLKNIDTSLQAYKGRVLVGLIQLSNRIKAKFESGQEGEITLPKSAMLTTLSRMIADFNEEIGPKDLEKLEELEDAIKHHINGSQLFNKEYNFLPSSAIGQLTGFAEKSELQRRYNPARIRSMFSTYTERWFTNYSKSEQITPAGYINNIVSFDSESDVNALFLKNGFLGTSFSIERPEIMFRIDNHFKLWQAGFGGGLLITGPHLSGRSTILEMLPINYPETTSYHIVPGQKMDVNGHKTFITNDLISSLEFIIKYKGADKCMITIDDLTYYTTNPEETYDLMTNLNRFIIKHSKQIYFAVVVHSLLYAKLTNFFDLRNVFTEVVNTDHCPVEAIERAVLTRAHAVANNDEVVSESDTLSSMARKVARKANENIGRAMHLWCMHRNKDYKPNLSSTQFRELVKLHSILLRTMLMHGAFNYLDVGKMLNEVDSRKLKYDINGLIQIKLLYRPKEGFVDINPYLRTFVESFLL